MTEVYEHKITGCAVAQALC